MFIETQQENRSLAKVFEHINFFLSVKIFRLRNVIVNNLVNIKNVSIDIKRFANC